MGEAQDGDSGANKQVQIREHESDGVRPESVPTHGLELNPVNVRNADIPSIIERAAGLLDSEAPIQLPADVVKCLVSRGVSESLSLTGREDLMEEVLWIESSEGEYVRPPANAAESGREYRGKYKFQNGIGDDGFGLLELAFKAIDGLDNDDKRDITDWILKMHHLIPRIGIPGEVNYDFALASFINKAQNRAELLGLVMDYVYDNLDEYQYLLPYEIVDSGARLNNLLFNFRYETLDNLPEYLIDQADDIKVKKILGVWVDQMTYPRVINTLRAFVRSHPSDKARLERVGRMLMGAGPDDEAVKFHTNLGEIYGEVDFENYPANIAATEREVEMIMSLLKDGDVVLDKGCGTGRISNMLAKKLHERNVKARESGEKEIRVKLFAFDSSEDNIIKAQEDDETHSVDYFLGNWNAVPLGNESVSLVIDLGRNNTHAESPQGLLDGLQGTVRVLKTGGSVLVDWPDPEKGEYLENRINYMMILRSLGIPIDPQNPEHLRNLSYVLDGPDGREGRYSHIYNRYVPDMGLVRFIYQTAGLELQELGRQPIEGWRDSENIYFQAIKKERGYGELSLADVVEA